MLEVENLSVSYGRHRALEGVSLKVGKGEICVILGANGAGKSTLLKAVAGMVQTQAGGAIAMNGKPIARLKPHRIVEEGIALVPEGRGIFGDLTVAENLQLGAFAARARADEAATLRRVYELFPRLAERKRQVARTMSGGEQQMVAIGRALMSKPDILMLDEPSLGLSPLLTQELFRSLTAVAATGVGILLVEQNAKQSLKIAGRGYLIENGHVTGENNAKALMNDPAVINAYLGGGTRRPARAQVSLPPSIRLPMGIDAIGRAMGDLAARAGRIQQAFVRALRRDEALPSAFVGRYDPKTGGDPWADVTSSPPLPVATPRPAPVVSPEARRVGDFAAGLAARAGDRLRSHVVASRLSAARPSAFASVRRESDAPAIPQPSIVLPPAAAPLPAAEPARSSVLEPADLSRRAAERLAAHLARSRAARPMPSAFAPPPWAANGAARIVKEPAVEVPPAAPASLIGHNSAGFDIEEPAAAIAQPSAPGPSFTDLAARAASIHAAHVARQRAPALSSPRPAPSRPDPAPAARHPAAADPFAGMVARAASIHAAHVAETRKRLSAFVIPAEAAAGGPDIDEKSAHKKKKKRKKHKES